MLSSIDAKFIFSCVLIRLSASLGDKGSFSTANLLHIDVVRRVVFLLFLLFFQPILQLIVRLFLPCETTEMFRHFVLTTKRIQLRAQVFSVICSIIWHFCCTVDVIFQVSQNSSKFGRQKLVMINYAWYFSQSETDKYFE